ncbi:MULTISPECIES: DUF6150 family protein [Janthinobacterium]|uniref:DUF6150 family protein n=1 Tax=Janthinobacterium kumbetense TaxID=2950280 RepID=A0ABT0WMC9_9BURK|nr:MULTISPECIES: DUF6150 family protein [Janthinobacterium]MCM2565224.1 DUF6150 family protein [Janthinobacterium kumbetense]MDN2676649.1 DUF6150 family protein [Janthinobacterium sp. SUN033]MDO8064537.1 DUF6150 family protein [Janthinobacterium sp. SUN206]
MARIYQTNNMGEADVRVAIVQRGNADLLVQRVSSWGLAHGDAHWFLTRERQDASASVYFTSQGFAQLTICFVDHPGEAGWARPHRFKGCLSHGGT